jgi:endonuclease I
MRVATLFGLALACQLSLISTSSAQSVFISELADPRLNYQTDRFLEIYNPGPSAVDLTGWRLVAIANNVDVQTWNLSGVIQAGQALVAGDQTLTIPFQVDFPAESWSSNNGNWNGRVGDGAKLIDASSTIVDLVVATGVLFENLDLVRKPTVTAPTPTFDASQWTGTPIDYPTQGSPGTHITSTSFPVIGTITTAPTIPAAGEAVTVSAVVTDTGANLTAVELRWGTAADALTQTIAMALSIGDTWVTTNSIAGQVAGTAVYFVIEAFNDVPASTLSSVQSYALADFVTIVELQGQHSASPYAGTTVRTEGVVTAVYPDAYVIQDGSGAWSGVWVSGSTVPAVGDAIEVQGLVTETAGNGFDTTTFLTGAQILASVAWVVPAPTVVNSAAAATEAYEGVLVQVLDATCTDAGAPSGVWSIDDGSGLLRVGELGFDSTATLGTRYDVTGPVITASGVSRVEPRSGSDITWSGDDFAPLLASVESVDPTTVLVTFTEPVDAVTAAVVGHYAIAGTVIVQAVPSAGDPTQVTLTTPELSAGSYTLVVDGVEDLYGNVVTGASKTFEVSAYGPPPGYYASASGLTGEDLRLALHQIIDDHFVVGYSSTLTVFQFSDAKPNGKVWDMYSDIPGSTPPYEYTFGVDSGSSAGSEGQGYNREHSWPRSWFGGDVSPMNSDLFQLYPTDIYVNSIRGSYPYGEVDAPDYTSLNGSKRGPNTYPGYTGIVFEPIDAYKGDFARSYFYMSVRYHTEDAAWPSSEMTDGADLLPWARSLLYEWHVADPVSQKERERNHVLFGYQGNRNPFIDHPEFAAAMFGITTSTGGDRFSSFRLRANTPNPFSGSTTISFEMARAEDVHLTVYDVRGRLVRTLADGRREAGSHVMVWNGLDDADRPVAAGTYYSRLRVGVDVQTKSMILVR